MDDEVPKINTFFNYNPGGDDKDAGEDGDTKNTDDDSDTEMGGTEDNTEVLDRLKALNDAKNAMIRDPPNPFPEDWLL